MNDAANYIKWILRGFNEGGVTAYMLHLFYEEADSNGYSSLVAWTPTGEIILPKRYYSFKHFTNLVKKGYSLITSNSTNENGVYVGGFISEDESKIILQVFNEGEEKDFSMDIPFGAISVEQILTTNNDSEEFISLGTQEINYYDRYFTTTLPELSLTSFFCFVVVFGFRATFLTSDALRTFFALIDFFSPLFESEFESLATFFGFDSNIILDIEFIKRSIEDMASSFAGII